MSTVFEPKSRNVIPRWRDFATTLELGELSRSTSRRQATALEVDLHDLEDDWTHKRTISFAADLISAAVINGGSDIAREAAKYVLDCGLDEAGKSLFTLATRVLNIGITDNAKTSLVQGYTEEELRIVVGEHRRRLGASPRNAVLWVDLALLYAMKGLKDKARKAITVAVGLEPNNRFVLRSAARLYLHIGEPDYAHRLLRRSEAVRSDPWIMAAELATANAAGFIPFSIDDATKLLARSHFDPADTTELSTAIATLELKEGSTSKAKKNIRSGLRSPNENSLAQVRWLLRDMRGFLPDLNVNNLNVERSFEAAAWEAHAKHDWVSAASWAVRWFKDQPFSSRPAVVGANIIAGLLENYESSISLANLGLVANPNEHALYILLAFSHGSLGAIPEAYEALSQIKGPITITTEVTVLANHGLLAFRQGRPSEGRLYYAAAADRADASGELVLKAGALTYWAREEILMQSDMAGQVLARAREAVQALGTNSDEATEVLRIVEAKYLRVPTGVKLERFESKA